MKDKLFIGLSAAAMLVILTMLAVILGNIIWFGKDMLSWEFVSAKPTMGMTEGGIFPAIFGTVALVFLMTIAVMPAGVLTAVYLEEYARADSKMVKIVQQAVANLAGVPSIVFGLFGLGFFVNFVGRGMDGLFFGSELHYGQPAIIWASATLALLTLPVVIVTTSEALRAVPREIKEGGLALGATRLQNLRRIIIPSALPGILTGGILAVSRGAGEVAPIMFTGAAYFLPYLPTSPSDQFMELGYHVYVMATQSPDVEATKPILYSTVFVLLALTFLLNLLAIYLRARLRKRFAEGR
ncbi:MAG TPA: phosphate ABC transporter permease PstA [candidate division Zixibacteria bacterium]|nr:phosphate ABC transporter permease PstA [candidate division Zixibacteria bacterium]